MSPSLFPSRFLFHFGVNFKKSFCSVKYKLSLIPLSFLTNSTNCLLVISSICVKFITLFMINGTYYDQDIS